MVDLTTEDCYDNPAVGVSFACDRKSRLGGDLNGTTIAVIIHSLDHSLSARLIGFEAQVP